MAGRSNTPAFAFGGAPTVNLMPRAAIERRERAGLLRRWGWGLAATLLVVALVGAGAYYLQAAAQQRLTAEQSRTNELLTQTAALQPVKAKLELQSELADFRTRAMGTDLEWAPLLATFQRLIPDGLAFEGVHLAPGGLLQGEDPASEIGVQGELMITGGVPADIVDLIRKVRKVPGVLGADGWTQMYEDNRYHHVVSFTFDQSLYTNHYAAEEGQ